MNDYYEVTWDKVTLMEVGKNSSTLVLTWGLDEALDTLVGNAAIDAANIFVGGEKKSMHKERSHTTLFPTGCQDRDSNHEYCRNIREVYLYENYSLCIKHLNIHYRYFV